MEFLDVGALIVVTAIVLTSDLDSAADLVDVVLVGVSLAVAGVPEGLPAVMSVVLALGVQRMAARRAIVAAFGSEKRRAVRQAVDAFPSHEVPASLLQLHPNVAFVVDRRAYAG